MIPEKTEFSTAHQESLLGHTLEVPDLWGRLDDIGLDKSWFKSAVLSEAFDQIQKFRKSYGRAPRLKEIEAFVIAADAIEGPNQAKAFQKFAEAAQKIGLDLLQSKLQDWAKSRFIVQQATSIGEAYNKGLHSKAYDLWEAGAVQLQKYSFDSDGIDRMESMAIRIDTEASERAEEAKTSLGYGVSFLDDSLIKIAKKDLIVIGAKTGVGKTEIAKIIAKHNASLGIRVSAFFLEAENLEIERRIKYSILVNRYLEDNSGASTTFGYAEWRHNMYEGSLGKYNAEADVEIKEKYKTLKTYYRKNGDFDLDTLDREIIKAHKDSDLIILDHLHYVDLDSKSNENAEMSKLVKKLRHLTLVLGVPIICIAHLKKGSAKTLVPELDDFHGSSEITKIATTCLMLAPCRNFITSDLGYEGGLPTFIRIAKFRLDGSRTGMVGMSFYDRNRGTYLDKYAIGRLNFAETKWMPHQDRPPYWAKSSNLITDVSEVE